MLSLRPRRLAAALLAVGAACAPRSSAVPSAPAASPAWVGTWMAAPQRVEERNLPPAPGLAGSTLRQVVRTSIGGRRVRVRLSNEFGDGPLEIGGASLARHAAAGAIAPGSSVALSFAGAPSVTIAAGATALSDPMDLALPPLAELAVSVHVTRAPAAITGHPGSRTTSYLAPGEHLAATALPAPARVERWYLLSGIDVEPHDARAAAVVVLGNSITDGRGSGTDRQNRWPDVLAARLQGDPRTRDVAVLNAGIGGNCVRGCGLGPPALERLERVALARPGARWLVVLHGVNDIGSADSTQAPERIAEALIEGYREIAARARGRGLRVYGATILPFGGSFYDAPNREAARRAVNRWIRASGAFDAVIDFDAALRDPTGPSRLRAAADGGDHLHPSEGGYRTMAEAVDLALFDRRD